MSTRLRFVKVDKNISKAIRNMNEDELMNYMKINKPDAIDSDDEKDSLAIYACFDDEVYNFGDILDTDKLSEIGAPYFKNKDTQEAFDEYKITLLDANAFVYAISLMQDLIIERYETLIKLRGPEDTYENRLKDEIKAKVNQWDIFSAIREEGEPKRGPHNMNIKTESICDSCFLEYEIFEVVRLYKTFNYEKYDIVSIFW